MGQCLEQLILTLCRLLEVAAVFASGMLQKQAIAKWQERQQAWRFPHQALGPVAERQLGMSPHPRVRRSPAPHQQGLPVRHSPATSVEAANLCHHLETIRKLQDLAEKRTAFDRNSPSQAGETETQAEAVAEPLAVALSNRGVRSERGVRITGIPGLASGLADGVPTLGKFDWTIPGERALVVKAEHGAGNAKEPGSSGAKIANMDWSPMLGIVSSMSLTKVVGPTKVYTLEMWISLGLTSIRLTIAAAPDKNIFSSARGCCGGWGTGAEAEW